MDKKLLHTALARQASIIGEIRADEPMSAHTTFAVGGFVDFLVKPRSVEGICAAIDAARTADAPWHVIGRGSNVLVADTGLPGLVIELSEGFSKIKLRSLYLSAQAGASNKKVAETAYAAGLGGFEFASGIPGSIGGAAYMNAGAYGSEFKDVCIQVSCLTPDGHIEQLSAAEAGWDYRHSMMMEKGWIVLEATLQLHVETKGQIRRRMEELAKRRRTKQPLEMASAGSTFKRPEGHYAAQLIDEAGMRGYTVGGAQISTKHCGFVVNTGNATAADIVQVIRDVQDAVYVTSGVTLETEVLMWGFDEKSKASGGVLKKEK